MRDSRENPVARALTAIAKLEMVSHGRSQNYDPIGHGGEGPDPLRGGIAYQDDREADFPQKSHLVFRRRLRRCSTPATFEALARDAEAALWAWQHTPLPAEPLEGTFEWKRMIANSSETAAELHRKYGVSRSTITRYRARYRTSP